MKFFILYVINFYCMNTSSQAINKSRKIIIYNVRDSSIDDYVKKRTVLFFKDSSKRLDSFTIFKNKVDFYPDTMTFLNTGDSIDIYLEQFQWINTLQSKDRYYHYYNYLRFADSLNTIPLENTYKFTCKDRKKIKYISSTRHLVYQGKLYRIVKIDLKSARLNSIFNSVR